MLQGQNSPETGGPQSANLYRMVDFNNLVNKAKQALGKNPSVIDKAGDFVDSKTEGKYSSQVDKAQDAAKKFVGGEQKPEQQSEGEQNPGQQQ